MLTESSSVVPCCFESTLANVRYIDFCPLTVQREDLHAFHGSRHCWHDCHAAERHVECVSVRILKVTAVHRSSCRPHSTRRRLKTSFGTFLLARNAPGARDSSITYPSMYRPLNDFRRFVRTAATIFESADSRHAALPLSELLNNVYHVYHESTDLASS